MKGVEFVADPAKLVAKVGATNAWGQLVTKVIDVEWKEGFAESRPVRINVVCVDKAGLLAAISSAIATTDVNISRAEARTTRDLKAHCTFEFNVESLDHLQRVIKNNEKVKGVIHVERVKTVPQIYADEAR